MRPHGFWFAAAFALVAMTSCGKLTGTRSSKNESSPSYLTVSPHAATIEAGSAVQLTATVFDGKDRPLPTQLIRWEVQNAANMATVDSTGLVTGLIAGTALVTATSETFLQDRAEITITNTQPVASVTISPSSATINVGEQVQLSAELKDASDAILNGRAVSWTSGNEIAASVNATGLVTALQVATSPVIITATSEGKSSTASISVQQAAVPIDLFGLAVANCGANMIAVGAGGRIAYLDGTVWQPQNSGTTQDLYSVTEDCSRPGFRCTAAGAGGTLLQFDGSAWSQIPSGTTTALNALDPADAPLWAAGAGGSVMHYDGSGWVAVANPFTDDLDWIGAPAAGPVKVLAVGASGTILTYDGTTWTRVTPLTAQTLRSVAAVNGGAAVFAVGDARTILRSSLSDLAHWNLALTLAGADLRAVIGNPAGDEAFAVGTHGSILHYTGVGWSAMFSPTTADLNAIAGPSFHDLYAVGQRGVILHYDGASWQVMVPPGP